MARANIDMVNIRQILRLYSEGFSKHEIERRLAITVKTVRKYIILFEESGLKYSEIKEMSNEELYKQFIEREAATKDRLEVLETLLPDYEKRLKVKGINRMYLWEEYKRKHPGGYNYTQFCHYFNKHLKKNKATMHIEHKAGDKIFVDFTGDKLQITDRKTGEITKVEVFVAILGSSGMTYVEAVMSQKKRDFISAVENSFIFYGGVPNAIVPDNLKSAVTKSDKYEPTIDEDFRNFALHYGVTVMPARAYRPKDKALVENAVRIIYTRIFAPLRDRVFFDLASLNEAIEELLLKHNSKNFQNRDYSRLDLFNEVEKHELKPLISEKYEIKDYAELTVAPNCYIYINEDKNYYSVPYRYIGHKVQVVYSSRTVEIYYGYTRIAVHKRDYRKYKYTTVKDHLSSQHNFYASWNPQYFIKWASSIGKETEAYIRKLLDSKAHPEQAYKSCVGVLSQGKKCGYQRLNNACRRALYYNSISYNTITTILNNRLDGLDIDEKNDDQLTLPLHKNVRGGGYYK